MGYNQQLVVEPLKICKSLVIIPNVAEDGKVNWKWSAILFLPGTAGLGIDIAQRMSWTGWVNRWNA